MDAIFIKVVDEPIYKKREGVLYKLDIEKTYDHVNWCFVNYMFGGMSFGEKWRFWMKACITTTSFVFLVNGSPSSFFQTSWGLR